MTVGEFLEGWVADHAATQVGRTTLRRYAGIVRQHLIPALGKQELAELGPWEIQGYYARALRKGRRDRRGGLSPTTVLQHHRVLRRALDMAVRWRMIESNPADAVDPPRRHRREIRILDEKETVRFLDALRGSRVYLPALLAVGTGMRRGEILALRWRDVDLDRGVLTVRQSLEQVGRCVSFGFPKTRAGRRQIALPPSLAGVLSRCRAQAGGGPEDLVCPHRDGRPWLPDSFSSSFAVAARRAELGHVRFHDLRHGHASHLLRLGIHPKVVAERLGHSTVGITLDIYSHLLPGMQKEAAEKVDGVLAGAMGRGEPG